MEERTSEIYKIMKNKKEEEERQAEEADKKQDIVWREQGKYSKKIQQKRVSLNIRVKHKHD